MRITINLPDDLILQAKKAAEVKRVRLSEFIADASRVALDSCRRKGPRRNFKLTSSGEGGVMPGVNLDDTSALLDIMDGIDKD